MIEGVGAEGKALARVGDMVVFTRYAVPGDVVDLQVTKKRKKYQEARCLNIGNQELIKISKIEER